MSLFITSLNSGSNGNCYYIGNETDAVLIDAGISCKETEKRMALLGLSMSKVRAVFISHEHIDHVKGLSIIARKYCLPVYITDLTLRHSGIQLDPLLSKQFKAFEAITIAGLIVTAFPKQHDAEDPHSFIIHYDGITVGVFTDIGIGCRHVIKYFGQCDAAFLEANYDDGLLENGRYPYFLKNRIRGGKGHLSNEQALEIFTKYRPPFMTHILLSHLSKDNNCPIKVKELFDTHAAHTNIVIASRYEQTPVYAIQKSNYSSTLVKKRQFMFNRLQLNLFDTPEP